MTVSMFSSANSFFLILYPAPPRKSTLWNRMMAIVPSLARKWKPWSRERKVCSGIGRQVVAFKAEIVCIHGTAQLVCDCPEGFAEVASASSERSLRPAEFMVFVAQSVFSSLVSVMNISGKWNWYLFKKAARLQQQQNPGCKTTGSEQKHFAF